ncbi:MAG: Thermophilic metalloprotease (M29) superfamily [Microgenomates bacterium 39_7]|nr:MAG: Thermophilic metalloprotease (M29) superfamily [Microgenomates bacterium 39_7]
MSRTTQHLASQTKKDRYQPSYETLQKYADVLVNFALNSGRGLQPKEVVELIVPDVAKSLALAMQNAVLRAGGHPLMRLLPTGFEHDYYNLASQEQLTFFPENYLHTKADLLDHHIQIVAEPFPEELKGVDPSKIIAARDARKPYKDWLTDKENRNNFTWTIALWGDQAKADVVGLSLEEYWQQIIQACFLDEDDPISRWKEVHQLQKEIKRKLNQMQIEKIHLESDDADLWLQIGANRRWCGGGGRNIPSFEIFTSPDWRGSQGWARFNQPLFRYGNRIEEVELQLDKGLVVQGEAQVGSEILHAMLSSPNADKLGEFSLTDKRMSRITHPMAEILFDENIGGRFGNTHIAIGSAYKECYAGERTEVNKEQWAELGFNDSSEHTDLISTVDRVVTAVMADGSKKVIYKDGQFVI